MYDKIHYKLKKKKRKGRGARDQIVNMLMDTEKAR